MDFDGEFQWDMKHGDVRGLFSLVELVETGRVGWSKVDEIGIGRTYIKLSIPSLVHPLGIYPLVNVYITIENGPVRIVDLPISHGDFAWLY